MPGPDTKNFMRGSLVHDALYQLMRNEYLDKHMHRKTVDKILRQIWIQDKTNMFVAFFFYLGIRLLGNPGANPANKRRLIKAP